MVAVSLYRGNMHKVPNVPRRFLMPDRKISLKDFKILVRRRSRALSLLSPSNPKPNHQNCEETQKIDLENETVENPKFVEEEKGDDVEKSKFVEEEKGDDVEISKFVEEEKGDDVEKLVEATESLVVETKEAVELKDVDVETKVDDVENDDVARVDLAEVKVEEIVRKKEDLSEKQKRRQEIEEKLKILNEKKHSLVQTLKHIINAEEEMKRRSNIQGVAGQPPVGAAQGERTHDSRHNTPRMGSEGNVSGDAEGAETDGANHNVHLRHLVRTSSTSPSSDAQHRKSPFTTAALPLRTNSGVANSPSRFALAGQQGLPPNLPPVSVSGTNYVASSPSPAASGGTSAFRDRRAPSPWN